MSADQGIENLRHRSRRRWGLGHGGPRITRSLMHHNSDHLHPHTITVTRQAAHARPPHPAPPPAQRRPRMARLTARLAPAFTPQRAQRRLGQTIRRRRHGKVLRGLAQPGHQLCDLRRNPSTTTRSLAFSAASRSYDGCGSTNTPLRSRVKINQTRRIRPNRVHPDRRRDRLRHAVAIVATVYDPILPVMPRTGCLARPCLSRRDSVS